MLFQKKIIAIAIVLFSILQSCEKRNNEQGFTNLETSSLDSSGKNYYHTKRALIHNATVDVQVNNIIQATHLLEEKTIALNGFITKADMQQSTIKEINNEIDKDSVLQIKYINPTALLKIRVPDSNMQKMLLYVQQLSAQINNRTIDAIDINNPSVNYNSTTSKVDLSEAPINKQSVTDLLDYCTISIQLNAPEFKLTQTLINKNASWLNASLLNKLKYNLQKGLFGLMNVVLFLIQFWVLIPIIVLCNWLLKKYKVLGNISTKPLK
jgi:hypothetical protein